MVRIFILNQFREIPLILVGVDHGFLLFSQGIITFVHHNPIQPVFKGLSDIEISDLFPHGQEGFLHDIFGIFLLIENPECNLKSETSITIHQFLERDLVFSLTRFYNLYGVCFYQYRLFINNTIIGI